MYEFITEIWVMILWIHHNEFRCHIILLNLIPWIENIEFHWFSVMNSYHELMLMKSDSWIQSSWIHNECPGTVSNQLLYLNSYAYEFILEFRIYTFEFIYMNSCTHEFIFSFHIWILVIIKVWIHIMIVWIHTIISYVYEFIYIYIYIGMSCPSWQWHRAGYHW